MRKIKYFFVCLFLTGGTELWAENAPIESPMAQDFGFSPSLTMALYLMLGLVIFMAITLFRIGVLLKKLGLKEKAPFFVEPDSRNFWEKLFQVKSIGSDKDAQMDHVYDGIVELDNPPPPWFMGLFYGTVIISAVYLMVYLFSDIGLTQTQEYEKEMASAAISGPSGGAETNTLDETNVVAITDPEKLSEGKKLFVNSCGPCHGALGEGLSGPNLTDEYWLHGGDIQSVFKTIKFGVPEKGMIAWKSSLNAEKIQLLASYVLSLRGSNPPKGLAPQGEKIK